MTQQSTTSHISVTLLSAALGLVVISGIFLLLPWFVDIYIEPSFGSTTLLLGVTPLLFIASAVTAFMPNIAHNSPSKKLMVLNVVLTVALAVLLALLTWMVLIASGLSGSANSTSDIAGVAITPLLFILFIVLLQIRHFVLLKRCKKAIR